MHLVGDHGETTSRLAGHGRLDGGVEGQNIGLVGDVVDELDDITNLLRAFTQALDTLGGLLNLFADLVHALDGVAHRLGALVRDLHRLRGHIGRLGGVGRHLADRHRHLIDCGTGGGDLLGLMVGCLGQVHGRGLRFLGRR